MKGDDTSALRTSICFDFVFVSLGPHGPQAAQSYLSVSINDFFSSNNATASILKQDRTSAHHHTVRTTIASTIGKPRSPLRRSRL